jgi:hypothetical protein
LVVGIATLSFSSAALYPWVNELLCRNPRSWFESLTTNGIA